MQQVLASLFETNELKQIIKLILIFYSLTEVSKSFTKQNRYGVWNCFIICRCGDFKIHKM